MLPGVVMYGAMAILCVWLGIGSMMACRWARALLLVGAWLGLILGIVIVVTMLVILPPILKSALSQQGSGSPGGAGLAFMAIPFLFVFVFTAGDPGRLGFLLQPKIREGDLRGAESHLHGQTPARFPFWPSVLLLLWAPRVCSWHLSSPPVSCLFWTPSVRSDRRCRHRLPGLPLSLARVGVLRCSPPPGGRAVAVILLAMLSNVITYSLHDMDEVYRLMNYSGEQMKYIENSPFIKRASYGPGCQSPPCFRCSDICSTFAGSFPV